MMENSCDYGLTLREKTGILKKFFLDTHHYWGEVIVCTIRTGDELWS